MSALVSWRGFYVSGQDLNKKEKKIPVKQIKFTGKEFSRVVDKPLLSKNGPPGLILVNRSNL